MGSPHFALFRPFGYLIEIPERLLFRERNLSPAFAARPWYRRCAYCALDEGGQHHDGCPWYMLIGAWEAYEVDEAQRIADEEREARMNEHLRREREAWRYARD